MRKAEIRLISKPRFPTISKDECWQAAGHVLLLLRGSLIPELKPVSPALDMVADLISMLNWRSAGENPISVDEDAQAVRI
jgi:hypothetical protein